MRVKSLVNARGNAVPNQFIIETRDKLVFQSYNSIICEYDKKTKNYVRI